MATECMTKLHLIMIQIYLMFLFLLKNKVFIQASGLACEVYVEVSPLCSLPTMVCEI